MLVLYCIFEEEFCCVNANFKKYFHWVCTGNQSYLQSRQPNKYFWSDKSPRCNAYFPHSNCTFVKRTPLRRFSHRILKVRTLHQSFIIMAQWQRIHLRLMWVWDVLSNLFHWFGTLDKWHNLVYRTNTGFTVTPFSQARQVIGIVSL